jgi:hypothetical protein
MAKKPFYSYRLVWSPTGQTIGTVEATSMKAAIRKAPKPYSKYKGEIYAEKTGTSNPRVNLPTGKMIKVEGVRVHKGGKKVDIFFRAPSRRKNTEGFRDASGHFHPIRSGDDYEPDEVGEARAYAPRKKAKKRK